MLIKAPTQKYLKNKSIKFRETENVNKDKI